MKIISSLLYLAGLAVLAWTACFGDWITAGATGIGSLLIGIPSILMVQDYLFRDHDAKLRGSTHATTAAFIRELKEVDLHHTSQVHNISMCEGKALARAEAAEQKIQRMTNRPRINGKLVKASDPTLMITAPRFDSRATIIPSIPGEVHRGHL